MKQTIIHLPGIHWLVKQCHRLEAYNRRKTEEFYGELREEFEEGERWKISKY